MLEAVVAFGGNVGSPERAFALALDRLSAEPALRFTRGSSLYRSAPWGNPEQPEFLNAVATFVTTRTPHEVLRLLRREERRAGRERAERWGPRELDLDLVSLESMIVDDGELVLPHPRLAERSFVLEPLAEIAPEWKHPVSGRSIAELLDELLDSGAATSCRRVRGVTLRDLLDPLEESCRS